jgi:glycosyltransferase involved in cell wall biosynthesis
MVMAKVSIIIPTFNCEQYVEECVLSATRQSEHDVEIIAVDDGSTDGTLEVLKKLASADSRICVYPGPRTGYAGATRNCGLAHAKGQYISFLDGDDLYHPEKITKSLAVLESLPDVDFMFHDLVRFEHSPNGVTSFLHGHRFESVAASHLQRVEQDVYVCHNDFYGFISIEFIPFHTSSVMLRRELLDSGDLRFREDLRTGEDGDLWLRLAKRCHVAFLDRELSYYRQRPGSLTADPVAYLRGTIQIHTENLQRGTDIFTEREVRLYRSKIAQDLFSLGYELFNRMNVRDSREAYRQSMSTKFRAKTLMAYLKTFVPAPVVNALRRARIEPHTSLV